MKNDENRSEFIRIASDMIKYVDDYCQEDTDRCILTIAWDGEEKQIFAGTCGDSARIADAMSTMALSEPLFREILLNVMKTTADRLQEFAEEKDKK